MAPERGRILKLSGNYDLSGRLKETAKGLRENDYGRNYEKVQEENMGVDWVKKQEQRHLGSGVCRYDDSWRQDWRT